MLIALAYLRPSRSKTLAVHSLRQQVSFGFRHNMSHRPLVLADLIAHLRSSVDAAVCLHVIDEGVDGLTIQVGDRTDATVGVQIRDALRPSFSISYPQLKIKRNGDQHVTTVQCEGVLPQGVAWVVGELVRHGVVKPEFSD